MSPYPRLDPLPAGVQPVKHYESLGATLVECHHDQQHRTSLIGAVSRGVDFCRLCRTVHPGRPVKMLAVVPAGQTPLF